MGQPQQAQAMEPRSGPWLSEMHEWDKANEQEKKEKRKLLSPEIKRKRTSKTVAQDPAFLFPKVTSAFSLACRTRQGRREDRFVRLFSRYFSREH